MTNVSDNFAVPSAVTVLRPTVLTADSLANLLAGAAEAHHIYEAKIGMADSSWESWYAAWIMDRLPVPVESSTRTSLRSQEPETGFDDEQGTYGLSAYPNIPSEDSAY
jgi:hypothetical protein